MKNFVQIFTFLKQNLNPNEILNISGNIERTAQKGKYILKIPELLCMHVSWDTLYVEIRTAYGDRI